MSRLDAETLGLLRAAAGQEEPVYLVGGALRDAVLGRATADLDLACASARKTALRLARELEGSFAAIDPGAQVFRVALARGRQIDVAGLEGPDIRADLLRRDFALNAMALPLSPGMPPEFTEKGLIDPRGGLKDLARRTLRLDSEAALKDDPLRMLRAIRIAAQLDFELDVKSLQLIRKNRQLIRRCAAERVQAELMALLDLPGCGRWVRLMDGCELLTALFDELEPARACATVYYGPGGVLEHSLATVERTDFLLGHLDRVFAEDAASIRAQAGPRALLILAALLHDVAKPACAKRVGGRLRFFGHDAVGASAAERILRRLKFSRASIDAVSTIVAHHLRPGNLAAGGEVTEKAAYRFFRDVGERSVDLLLVCWADHASYLPAKTLVRLLKAARADPASYDPGRLRDEASRKTVRHLQVVHGLLRRRFAERGAAPLEKLVDGRDVMKTTGIPPGPKVGRLLEKVREAQALGKLKTREEALQFLAKARK